MVKNILKFASLQYFVLNCIGFCVLGKTKHFSLKFLIKCNDMVVDGWVIKARYTYLAVA